MKIVDKKTNKILATFPFSREMTRAEAIFLSDLVAVKSDNPHQFIYQDKDGELHHYEDIISLSD